MTNMSRWFLIGTIFVSGCKCCMRIEQRQPVMQLNAMFVYGLSLIWILLRTRHGKLLNNIRSSNVNSLVCVGVQVKGVSCFIVYVNKVNKKVTNGRGE